MVPDHTQLHRQIYLRGIPLEGLLSIFCRQLARQVGGVRADPMASQMAYLEIYVVRGNSADHSGKLRQLEHRLFSLHRVT